jgi:hypothetical protein
VGQLVATAWMQERRQTRMVVSALLHGAETNRKETAHIPPQQERLKHKPWILAVQPAQTDDPTILGESSNGATITWSSVCQDPAQCYKICTRSKALDSDAMACTDRGSHKIWTALSLHNDATPTVGNTAWSRSMKNILVSRVECHGFWVACDFLRL